jgi:membrane protease YdiL (CAAX protease family)
MFLVAGAAALAKVGPRRRRESQGMKSFAIRRPATAYYLLALGLAAGVIVFGLVWTLAVDPNAPAVIGEATTAIYKGPGYANLVTLAAQALRHPLVLTVFAYAFAPTIAALTIASTGANGGLKRLLARLRPVGRDGGGRQALFVYLGILAVYAFGLYAYDWVAGPGVNAYVRLGGLGPPAAIGALIGLFLDEGGTSEELGWRGFLWPALRDRMRSPVLAVLLLGALHWGLAPAARGIHPAGRGLDP